MFSFKARQNCEIEQLVARLVHTQQVEGSSPSLATNQNTMIQIINDKVFVNGKETVNPELIGLAVLDFIDNDNSKITIKTQSKLSKDDLRDKFFNHLKENNLRHTHERKTLIELAFTINPFEPTELVKRATDLRIAQASCYNFIQTCVDAGIVEIQPRKYFFK